jgi:nucleotide-binding universal stress UspA family protein
LEGPIAESLHEHALGKGCDLVVMTTHGRGPVSRFWLGSVADRLVHRLPIPLLLIRTREEKTPSTTPEVRKILVALDGTPTAEQILGPAGELAKLYGASLTLLRVVPAPTPREGSTEVPHGALLVDTKRAETSVYLQRVTDSLRDRGFNVQGRIIARDHPATAILNEAASGEYDLLALGTHGRRGLPRLFLGSVADKVVRGATLPVLVHRCLPE